MSRSLESEPDDRGALLRLTPASSRDSSGGSGAADAPATGGRRKRGRPLEMTREELLAAIRRLSERREGLFRVHHTHSGLYARARRLYGSWSNAVRAAGIDYEGTLRRLRERARARVRG